MNADDAIFSPNHRSDSQPSSAPEALGPLRGQVWLTIQTHQAQQLVRGRNGTLDKPAIIGLVGFADRLRIIWQAARNDDPYADWWLIKVHEGIEAAESLIQQHQQAQDTLLQQMGSMEVTIATSRHPFRMPLQFANPYAYQGAKLLSAYDTLVRTALTAQHVGLLDSESCQGELKVCARKIRSLFCIPQGYRFLRVNRESLQKASGKSHDARQAMGEVPEDVLSGERQAPLFPRKLRFPSGFANHIGLHPTASNPPRPNRENDSG